MRKYLFFVSLFVFVSGISLGLAQNTNDKPASTMVETLNIEAMPAQAEAPYWGEAVESKEISNPKFQLLKVPLKTNQPQIIPNSKKATLIKSGEVVPFSGIGNDGRTNLPRQTEVVIDEKGEMRMYVDGYDFTKEYKAASQADLPAEQAGPSPELKTKFKEIQKHEQQQPTVPMYEPYFPLDQYTEKGESKK